MKKGINWIFTRMKSDAFLNQRKNNRTIHKMWISNKGVRRTFFIQWEMNVGKTVVHWIIFCYMWTLLNVKNIQIDRNSVEYISVKFLLSELKHYFMMTTTSWKLGYMGFEIPHDMYLGSELWNGKNEFLPCSGKYK